MSCSISGRATGSSEKSRTIRRRITTSWNSMGRTVAASGSTEQYRRSIRKVNAPTLIEANTSEGMKQVKTMTCMQLGGPCEFALHGDTADQVIKAQDSHLKEMVAGSDLTHESALKAMQGRWKHPISGIGWYRTAKRNFAALPED